MGSRAFYVSGLPVSISLASLPNGAFAVSSVIDNSIDRFMFSDIQIKMRTGTGIPAFPNRPTVAVFLLRSVDGGVTFDDAGDNAQLVDVFQTKISGNDYKFTADTSNIGQLPEFWKIMIKNKTGVAFDSNPANFSVTLTGKKLESTVNGV